MFVLVYASCYASISFAEITALRAYACSDRTCLFGGTDMESVTKRKLKTKNLQPVVCATNANQKKILNDILLVAESFSSSHFLERK